MKRFLGSSDWYRISGKRLQIKKKCGDEEEYLARSVEGTNQRSGDCQCNTPHRLSPFGCGEVSPLSDDFAFLRAVMSKVGRTMADLLAMPPLLLDPCRSSPRQGMANHARL